MTRARASWPGALSTWTSRRWPVAAGALFWVVIPALCLASLAVGTDQFARHVDNIPAGTRGTFQVSGRTCDGRVCVTTGTFTASDRSVVVPDAVGDHRWLVGRQYNAVYDPTSGKILARPGNWDPSATIIGMVGALAFLTFVGWCLRSRVVKVSARNG
jgi:hypothetical protein